MDFEYFNKVIRSEDEAQQQLEWKRSRRLLTQSHMKGFHEKRGRGSSIHDFQKVKIGFINSQMIYTKNRFSLS